MLYLGIQPLFLAHCFPSSKSWSPIAKYGAALGFHGSTKIWGHVSNMHSLMSAKPWKTYQSPTAEGQYVRRKRGVPQAVLASNLSKYRHQSSLSALGYFSKNLGNPTGRKRWSQRCLQWRWVLKNIRPRRKRISRFAHRQEATGVPGLYNKPLFGDSILAL